jgi:predicted nucleotidyltransferase
VPRLPRLAGKPVATYTRFMAVAVNDRVLAAISRLCEAEPGVVSAYLFGSRAEGREHRESDLDVGLLLEHGHGGGNAARFALRVRASSQLEAATGFPTDVVILNDTPPTLARHVVTRGLRVFCRDAEIDHAFVRDAQLRAADLEPFLRRTRKVKLEALAR